MSCLNKDRRRWRKTFYLLFWIHASCASSSSSQRICTVRAFPLLCRYPRRRSQILCINQNMDGCYFIFLRLLAMIISEKWSSVIIIRAGVWRRLSFYLQMEDSWTIGHGSVKIGCWCVSLVDPTSESSRRKMHACVSLLIFP